MASEGIEFNQPEMPETDPYTESRKQPLRSYKTPSSFDKLKQFLELDRKVLRFYCVWDDRDSMFGEMRPCVSDIILVVSATTLFIMGNWALHSFSCYLLD